MQPLHRNIVLVVLLLALFCVPMPALAALDTLTVNIDNSETEFQAFVNDDALYLSASDIAAMFDVTYTHDTDKNTVVYVLSKSLLGKKEAIFTIDSCTFITNGKSTTLDQAPIISDDTVLIPANAISTIWNVAYGYNDDTLYINTDGSEVIVPQAEKVFVEEHTVSIGDKTSVIRYIRIPQSSDVKIDLALAQNAIGKAEELSSMATRTSAKAAINGGFFQNFDKTKAQEPYGILIKDGKLVHSDNTGSTLGFTKDGKAKLDLVRTVITVKANQKEYTANLLNHSPAVDSDCIALFTSAYGDSVNQSGTAVIVQNGIISAVTTTKTVSIPKDGYVLLSTGKCVSSLASLQKGDEVSYTVSYVTANSAKADWSDVQTAIGAGPILVNNGKVAYNPAKEGFTDETSFQISVTRSAVGITEDGSILLVGGVKCSSEELAAIMVELGAIQAISMDSGSSSGLYCTTEERVVAPMKAISNALIFK